MSETDVGLPQLPDGWMWTPVERIAEKIRYGYTASAANDPIGPKFLRITDIQNNSVNWASVPYCQIDEIKQQQYLLKENDLVFARTGATVGKSFLIQGSIPDAVFASYLIRIILKEEINAKFVYIFFQSQSYWLQIHQGKVGSGQPNVNAKVLSQITLPLPPLPEQHRIVAKIEELFTKLDAGINELHKAQSQLKWYRQSVLKAAFEGKLTEAWRAEHQEKIEPATPVTSDLPAGWVWTTLEAVSELNPRIDRQSIDDDLEVTFLPMKNVEELSGKIDLSETKRFSELKRKNYTPFRDSDILFAKVTPCMENGKIAIAHNLKNGIGFGSTEFHVIRLPEEQSKQFFFFYFLQQKFRQEAKRAMTSGVGLLRVPTGYMRKVPIPLPPLLEQQAIVSEVESRLSVADEVEKTVTAELKRAEQLRQSILKKAFSGKLVPQDPNDEPASVLLERIKAQKEIVF